MKNKNRINYFLAFSLLIFLSTSVIAQSTTFGFVKSNIYISVKTEAVFENSKTLYIRPLDKWETINGKDILHRRLVDTKNSLFFGYDVEVTHNAQPNKYNVAIKPLSYKSGSNQIAEKAEIESYTAVPLPKYPNETVVENGDIIKLVLLESSEKRIKIIDYLKISDGTKQFAGSFSELQPTRDFTINDVNLKLKAFEIFINGKSVAKIGGGGSGANIYFTVPGKGRFIVSPFPREGYNLQKIGKIIDNKLFFTINNDKYKVVSESSILGDGGNWNAWILADPNYKKEFVNPKNPNSIQIGAADDIKFFFTKSELNEK